MTSSDFDKIFSPYDPGDGKVRVRFAPSPTGQLHIGGVRTAIYNWAFARRNGGTFILRIDDTDPERSTEANTRAILDAMKWIGMDWDEGPEVGGPCEPYFQTQRAHIYQAALEKMKANGSVYPCFCSAEELAAKREANQKSAGYTGYDRTCRSLSPEEAQARIDAGESHVWRVKVPEDRGDIVFEDAIYGTCTFHADIMDDFIVMRSDGTPTYNFTTAVDDAIMGITHIIRGDDHLSNTPRQILVYEALGMKVPMFAHLSMILGPDGKRLSKRHGATSVQAFREAGYLPEAMMNYLSLLGWSLDGETTIFSLETLCNSFSIDRISRNPAIFDETKLAWVNSVYIKEMGAKRFVDLAAPYLVDAGLTTAEEIEANRSWYEEIYPLVRERIKVMPEVVGAIAFLFRGTEVEFDEKSVAKVLGKEGVPEVIDSITEVLGDDGLAWNAGAIEEAMRALLEKLGKKPKEVFQVARVALTGSMVSPPLFESIALLSREVVLARLESAKPVAQAAFEAKQAQA